MSVYVLIKKIHIYLSLSTQEEVYKGECAKINSRLRCEKR